MQTIISDNIKNEIILRATVFNTISINILCRFRAKNLIINQDTFIELCAQTVFISSLEVLLNDPDIVNNIKDYNNIINKLTPIPTPIPTPSPIYKPSPSSTELSSLFKKENIYIFVLIYLLFIFLLVVLIYKNI
jgi:hypothetical protein